jgi:hypothetical protein
MYYVEATDHIVAMSTTALNFLHRVKFDLTISILLLKIGPALMALLSNLNHQWVFTDFCLDLAVV